jgi:hypothetical protein
MAFRQRTHWFSSRRGELGFNGFWLAMVCALLLAAPASAGTKASPLPSFSIARLSSVAHAAGNDYAVVLWWLQQAQATQSTSSAVPPHSTVISALCERAVDSTNGHFVSALDENAKELIHKLSSEPTVPDESTFTPSYPPVATQRDDSSRRLLAISLAPHEALMRSGTSYCCFLE